MAIAAESSLLTGPPSAADWVAAGVAAVSEMSVTAIMAASCKSSGNGMD